MRIGFIVNKGLLFLSLAIFIFVFAGMFYSLLSDVKVIASHDFDSSLFIYFISAFFLGLLVFVFCYFQNKSSFKHLKNSWKMHYYLSMPAIYAVLLLFTTFGALPKGLHNIFSVNDSIELTVIEKIDNNSRGKCAPRIIVKEITFSPNGHICISEDDFNKVQVGRKFTGIGLISNFGIELISIR